MTFDHFSKFYIQTLQDTLSGIDREAVDTLVEDLLNHTRIFLVGKGRTGLVMDMFAMRLSQIGMRAYSIGKPTTPAAGPKDLLVAASGSGETVTVLLAVNKAKEIGMDVAAITLQPESSLSIQADHMLILAQEEAMYQGQKPSKVLTGTLFEQALMLTLECVIGLLMEATKQTFDDLSARHANIE